MSSLLLYVPPIHIPIPPFVPEVASSELDGDPYTFEDPNPEDEGYEDAYASDSDEEHEEYHWSAKQTTAFVKVWGRDPSIHEFKDVRDAHLAVSDSNLREYGPQPPYKIAKLIILQLPNRKELVAKRISGLKRRGSMRSIGLEKHMWRKRRPKNQKRREKKDHRECYQKQYEAWWAKKMANKRNRQNLYAKLPRQINFLLIQFFIPKGAHVS